MGEMDAVGVGATTLGAGGSMPATVPSGNQCDMPGCQSGVCSFTISRRKKSSSCSSVSVRTSPGPIWAYQKSSAACSSSDPIKAERVDHCCIPVCQTCVCSSITPRRKKSSSCSSDSTLTSPGPINTCQDSSVAGGADSPMNVERGSHCCMPFCQM